MMDYLRKQASTALRRVLLGAGTVAWMACGDDPVNLGTDGTIMVAATTVGSDFDVNGYTFSVNSGQGVVIGSLDTVYVNDLEAGSYQVGLGGIADNCSTPVDGNPKTVVVLPADTVKAEFQVTCDVPDGGGGGPPAP
jgi:hypothetical protein